MEKIKVIIDRTEPSSTEIREGMDFAKLNASYTGAVNTTYWLKALTIGGLAVGIAAVCLLGVEWSPKKGDEFALVSGSKYQVSGIKNQDAKETETVPGAEATVNQRSTINNQQLVQASNQQPATSSQQPLAPRYSSLDEFYKERSIEPQYFTITADRDTMIKGKQGTELYIRAGSFVDAENKPAAGEVAIALKECYALDDMLKENLSTMADKEILQSGGMIWLGAKSGEKELQLKKFAEIEMVNPLTEVMEDTAMFIYHGEKNEKGELNWKLDKYSRVPYPVAVFTGGKFHDSLGIAYFAARYRFNKAKMVELINDSNGYNCTLSFSELRKVIGSGGIDFTKESAGTAGFELVDLLDNVYAPFVQPATREVAFTFRIMQQEDFLSYTKGYAEYKKNEDLKKAKNFNFGTIVKGVALAKPNSRFYIGMLGWTNCDKPRLSPNPIDWIVTNTVQLKRSETGQEQAQLIIDPKGRPSVVNGIKHPLEELWMFPNIPVGTEVTLKGTLLLDGQVYETSKQIKVREKERARELSYTMPSFQ